MDLVKGHFSEVIGGIGGNCALCNRLRLTANGLLKPCLFSNLEYDIRELGFQKALDMAIESKPACGSTNETGAFYNIGG
jgi:cyclic pyranopterin phosphate synthase